MATPFLKHLFVSVFSVYFQLGYHHIFDFGAYDHMVFLLALCAVYSLPDWRKILILVTSFTIGHSVTLALSTLNIVQVNAGLIEFLIPVTILITCIFNFIRLQHDRTEPANRIWGHYALALGFGLIHGLGFSNYLKSLLGAGTNIVTELLAFNLGVEAGQILIVVLILAATFVATQFLNFRLKYWGMALSAVAGVISVWLLWQNISG